MTTNYPSIGRIKENWEKFKNIETHSESDIDELMKLLSDAPSMENPMMKAGGRQEVKKFLTADIAWSKPVYYWEVFESNRLAFRWSQYPLQNTKENPKLLNSCATWLFDENGLLDKYYATWCRVECYEVMIDAGFNLDPKIFFGSNIIKDIQKSIS